MTNFDDLIQRINERVADPMRAVDSAAWVSPVPRIAAPASTADADRAEAAFGFSLPTLLRRLYTEVGNGKWGPSYGLQGIPTDGATPDTNDIVGMYLECTAQEREIESPAAQWPRGLVTLIGGGCVDFEVCNFLQPPYPISLLSGDTWEADQPVVEALTPIAASLEERLETWLAS